VIYLLLSLIILFLVSLYTYVILISPYILLKPFRKKLQHFRNKKIITDPGYYGVRYENISFHTFDNYLIKGWVLLSPYPEATIIFFHGISDARYSHLEFMSKFAKKGYNVLMYDLRAHGESEGKFCTYGHFERQDVKSAINMLERIGIIDQNSILGLMGVSLGGAIALQSLNVDKRIKFVITEAAFSNFKSTMDDYKSIGIFRITGLFWNIIEKRIEKIGNFKINSILPFQELADYNGKSLLIHGDKDEKIDIKYHSELVNNAKDVVPFIVQGAGHNNLREKGGKDYFERILNFANKIIYTKY